MYQIRATLCSKSGPTLGSATIRFPIPWKEYDQVLARLKPLGIGGPIDRDCQIESLDSRCSILKRLEETLVNLDELDYLAKRLDSFDGSEALQFQAAAAAKDISSIRDFINLTFCCNEEGKFYGMAPNRRLGKHIICGPFFLVGDDGAGDFASFTNEQLAWCWEQFGEPQQFTGEEPKLEPRLEFYPMW